MNIIGIYIYHYGVYTGKPWSGETMCGSALRRGRVPSSKQKIKGLLLVLSIVFIYNHLDLFVFQKLIHRNCILKSWITIIFCNRDNLTTIFKISWFSVKATLVLGRNDIENSKTSMVLYCIRNWKDYDQLSVFSSNCLSEKKWIMYIGKLA